jgi:DNA polymerase-3 subunit beta
VQLTVNSQDLAKELRALAKIAPTKPSLPILSHVLLSATDKLRLSATDLELALSMTCQACIEQPGVIALPVAKLLGLIEQFTDGDVSITSDKQQVVVKSGAFKSRLQAMAPEDFPQLPEPEGVSNMLAGREFRQMIERTRYAIASESSKYLLQGALLTIAGPVAAMCATDGKRLALASMAREGADARVILPAKTLDILASGSEIDLEFTVGDRHLFFASGGRLLVSRTLDGEFPKYERIIPRDNNNVVTIERTVFAAALRRVGLLAEENRAVYLTFAPQSLELASSSAEVGSADERLPVGYDGPALRVCINGSFVLDFLNEASGQTVTMAIKDANSAVLLTDGDDSLGVIMPIRG